MVQRKVERMADSLKSSVRLTIVTLRQAAGNGLFEKYSGLWATPFCWHSLLACRQSSFKNHPIHFVFFAGG
jgi:hypothetical protein